MRHLPRFFVAATILLSGVALLPFVTFSSEPLGWQRYASVYEPAPVQVNIQDFAYVPDTVRILAGTTVRWTNLDSVDHTVTSESALFDSGTLAPGDSFEYRFDTPGVYPYFCTLHPTMTGTVVVVDVVTNVYLPVILR